MDFLEIWNNMLTLLFNYYRLKDREEDGLEVCGSIYVTGQIIEDTEITEYK